jgi:hypothetical protein
MSDERKTLEQPRKLSEQMTDLERLRHSASHILATAIFVISSGVKKTSLNGGLQSFACEFSEMDQQL